MLYDSIRPLLFKLDAERAHKAASLAARLSQRFTPSILKSLFEFEDASLYQSLWGQHFSNPVGLAAGFDKNARLVRFWEQIGFGFVEVGSVSARPSRGNPRPRLFRLMEEKALINRMGLNNDGAERVVERLKAYSGPVNRPLGVNLAKTHDPSIMGEAAVEDFRRSFALLAPFAGYVVLNISCPNTREGKTFESPEALDALLRAIFAERREQRLDVPVLVKLSPAVSDRVIYDSLVEEIVAVSLEYDVAGFVATNTASDREGLRTPEDTLARIGQGGLSGAPIAGRSTRLIRYLYQKTGGRLPIIGVGGIMSAEDAYRKIRAGASLVELYTGLVYEGPGLVRRIKEGLVALLQEDGIGTIREAVGADVRLETSSV